MEMQTWNNWFIICQLICRCHTSVHGGHWPPEERLFDLHLFWDTGAGEGISHETLPPEVIKDQNDLPTLPNWVSDQDLVGRINLKKKNKAIMELNVYEKQDQAAKKVGHGSLAHLDGVHDSHWFIQNVL